MRERVHELVLCVRSIVHIVYLYMLTCAYGCVCGNRCFCFSHVIITHFVAIICLKTLLWCNLYFVVCIIFYLTLSILSCFYTLYRTALILFSSLTVSVLFRPNLNFYVLGNELT